MIFHTIARADEAREPCQRPHFGDHTRGDGPGFDERGQFFTLGRAATEVIVATCEPLLAPVGG